MEYVFTQIDHQPLIKTNIRKDISGKLTLKISSVMVVLMIFQAIVSATVFDRLQIAVELIILLILLALIIMERRLQKEEIGLLAVFLVSQIGSIVINDWATFMLNAKQYGLAVFSLVYYRRHHCRSILIPIVFVLCIILVLLQRFVFHRFPFEIAQYLGTLSNETATRPMGLFLNFHFSAFFLAVCLIGYTNKRSAFFLDYYLLWIVGVRTSIFS